MQKVKAPHQAIANHDEACRNIPKILAHDNTIPEAKAQPKYRRSMRTYEVRRIFRMTGVSKLVRIASDVPTNPDAIAPNVTVALNRCKGTSAKSTPIHQHMTAETAANAKG